MNERHGAGQPGRRSKWMAVMTVALVIGAASCGYSDDDLAAVETDAAASVAAVETDLQTATNEAASLRTDVSTLEAAATEQAKVVETQETDLATAATATKDANKRADTAEARVAELLAKYDVEIRAAAQAAWNLEVVAACEAAGAGTAAFATFVTFTEEHEIIGTKADLVAAVEACAAPLRNRSEEEKLNADCSTGDPDAVSKDTSGLAGECYVVFVIPFQWDSRTGDCAFLGHWDSNNLGTYGYKYDGDGLFQAPQPLCGDQLGESDQDDLLKLWVTLVGPYHYDTAAGGTNEVPEFRIVRAELVTKA